jgi:predicted TIM-barrel fold metal-dependent hydrolase
VKLTAPPDPHPRVPKLRAPPQACDCHFHLFGPASRYPFRPESRYISADALPETYFDLQRVLGLSRGVVVSGGGYGTDYGHLEHMLERFPERLRGIVLPPADLAAPEIRRLERLGVRGMRFISPKRFSTLPALDEALARRAFDAAGWQVHLYAGGDLEAHAARLQGLPNTVVLDHFGGIDADLGDRQMEMRVLLELLDSGKVWVKLSGPMRCTKNNFPYAALTPIARRLVEHAPERLLWGSDWPHVNMNDRPMPNDGDLLDLLADWVPDDSMQRKILEGNPAKLFF